MGESGKDGKVFESLKLDELADSLMEADDAKRAGGISSVSVHDYRGQCLELRNVAAPRKHST